MGTLQSDLLALADELDNGPDPVEWRAAEKLRALVKAHPEGAEMGLREALEGLMSKVYRPPVGEQDADWKLGVAMVKGDIRHALSALPAAPVDRLESVFKKQRAILFPAPAAPADALREAAQLEATENVLETFKDQLRGAREMISLLRTALKIVRDAKPEQHVLMQGTAIGALKLSDGSSLASPSWISVKDRLPAVEGDYLVWQRFDNDGDEGAEVVHYDPSDSGQCDWPEYTMHWMPLPEPPGPPASEPREHKVCRWFQSKDEESYLSLCDAKWKQGWDLRLEKVLLDGTPCPKCGKPREIVAFKPVERVPEPPAGEKA